MVLTEPSFLVKVTEKNFPLVSAISSSSVLFIFFGLLISRDSFSLVNFLQYAFQSDLMSLTENSPYGANQGLVANAAMAPYGNITYTQINQPGKQWTKEFTAALTSELLGLVRGKYQQAVVPGSEVNLNFADLISRGQARQKELRDVLRLDLEDMSRKAQLERKQSENDSLNSTLVNIPIPIFIG